METTDLNTGEVITQQANFHSKIEVNLEATDLDKPYNEMTEVVLERSAEF